MHRLLDDPRVAAFIPPLGRLAVKSAVAGALESIRRGFAGSPDSDGGVIGRVMEALEQARSQTPTRVINATGILLHTNLGRAPLAPSALDAVAHASQGYLNLEYDLGEGRRGSRYRLVSSHIAQLTGAEDALVVNNCAAAMLLILDSFAKGREAIAARGQLIEIGAGFRLAEVVERSGAQLVEVGAVNKVYLHDYERALTPKTAMLLRSHPSNFSMTGFTQEVTPSDLVALGRRARIPVVEDLGSGAVFDLGEYGLPHERTVQDAVADGVDLIAFSGDKLLGGPQAGIIVGNSRLIGRLLNNPLVRALRVDKMTLAALAETLRLHQNPQKREEIPLIGMLAARAEQLQSRAQRWIERIPGAQIVDSVAYIGGGVLAEHALPSVAVALRPQAGCDGAARALRRRPVPIVARIQGDRLLFDLRTIFADEDDAVIDALSTL